MDLSSITPKLFPMNPLFSVVTPNAPSLPESPAAETERKTPLLAEVENIWPQIPLNPKTKTAVEAALMAGAIVKRGLLDMDKGIDHKEGAQNLVTKYDKLAEEAIIGAIKAKFPDHGFLGEESGLDFDANSPVVWIIDPIDGTRMFANGVGTFSISIAAAEDGKVASAVVYVPMLGQLFVAERGKGAYLNGKPIKVSLVEDLTKSVIGTDFPYSVRENPKHCIDICSGMIGTGARIAIFGSAITQLAYVAAGKFDAFWHAYLYPWDLAASSLLIEEAGGSVTDWEGNPLNPFATSSVVATNQRLQQTVLDRMKLYGS